MRTIIELPGDQLDALADLCRAEGISRAEAIRRAVLSYVRGARSKALTSAFGLWRDRPIDGLEYERQLRDEWQSRPRATSRRTRKRR